jgi:hypothetical protein
MSEESQEEILAMFSAWEEFKESVLYKELVITGHPLSMLAIFSSGWRAKRDLMLAKSSSMT